MSETHSWSFTRLGGFDQVLITNRKDILQLEQLDTKLWAALSCPTTGLHFDEKTLQLIDSDHDQRIRIPEILAAIRWLNRVLLHPERILMASDRLLLSEINSEDPEGKAIYSAAERILQLLGKSTTDEISLADITTQQDIFSKAVFNGDGIIIPASSDQPQLTELINTIIQCCGSVLDASGEAGINSDLIHTFFKQIEARLAWLNQANEQWIPEQVEGQAAVNALKAVRDKIDDYFSRCRASQYDHRASQWLNRQPEDWSALTHHLLSQDCDELAEFPLALINKEGALPLTFGINPAWSQAIHHLNEQLISPIYGAMPELDYETWCEIKARFDDYQRWLAAEAGQAVANLNHEQLTELSTLTLKDALLALIEQDLAVKPQVEAQVQIERLLRYCSNLNQLLANFLNLTDFYSQDKRSIFEAGTLYLDSRACDLCIEVTDTAKHAALAGLSKCFLAYCDCTSKTGEKKTIVAAFTGGSADYLMVGRNGVFYDRKGLDWDATITKLIENPISVREAFFSPYKRLVRFLEEQATKSATAAEAASQESLQNVTTETLTAKDANTAKATIKPKFDLSIIAAMGVAVGGIATALGMMLQAFFGLGWLMPLGLVGIMLLISGPSMFIAWLKLRQRNLGPLLDASGWAINGRVSINASFGSKLTKLAHLPARSKRIIQDPYQSRRLWPWLISFILLAAVATWWFWEHPIHFNETKIEQTTEP